ncbi:MAG: 5-amino-6-(D-ribitylamino)uracil--L-tyrosine 4-hydroxyphenyl transferase CofH, partial [Gammaproteobacteria bacterium]
VIIQNFRAKPETRMASAPEPDLDELLWTIAVARLVFGPEMNIQAPPNLSPGVLEKIIAAGINDWGGVSPLTPDHVNPEAPWPHLQQLARETEAGGKYLDQRLTIYPSFIRDRQQWLDPALHGPVMKHCDAAGFAKRDNWTPGQGSELPGNDLRLWQTSTRLAGPSPGLQDIVARCRAGKRVAEVDIVQLFNARGNDFAFVIEQARDLARQIHGNTVSYVVNRNINYTNVCYFRCQFCAFSKGKLSENLRGKPYDISADELARRSKEAWDRGATEVCLQGGIHPDYTGETYLDILRTVRRAAPDIHIHAFSPLEIWQGAATLGMELKPYLQLLQANGLNTLPGTAAEILDDPVRAIICPDKLNTREWLEVMATAHELGIRTTVTIMFGHVDQAENWARHLLRIRDLQADSAGFTEFVPLPYVPMEAPLYLKNKSRKGPSFREAVLMHAVPRLVFHGLIDNIQASWVKMGMSGALHCLEAGANDLGGTLMNESITRAAGAEHGQEWAAAQIEAALTAAGKQARMRTTLYGNAPVGQAQLAKNPPTLSDSVLDSALKKQRSKKLQGSTEMLQLKSV